MVRAFVGVLLALLFAGSASAQPGGAFSPGGGQGGLPICTIGAGANQAYPLGTCRNTPTDGNLVIFTDAASKSDCSIGGGSEPVLCQWDVGNGAAWKWEPAAAGLAQVVQDTSPTLGGNLTLNGFAIATAGGLVTSANVDLLRNGLAITEINAFTEGALEAHMTGTPNLLKAGDAATALSSVGLASGRAWVGDGGTGWTSADVVQRTQMDSVSELESILLGANLFTPSDTDMRASGNVNLGTSGAATVTIQRGGTTLLTFSSGTQVELNNAASFYKSGLLGVTPLFKVDNAGFATIILLDTTSGSFNLASEDLPVTAQGQFERSWIFGNLGESGFNQRVGFAGIGDTAANGGYTELRPIVGTAPLRLKKGTGDVELGTEIVVRDTNAQVGERGRPALAQYRLPLDRFLNQTCSTAGAINTCPDPAGVLAFEGLTAWADVPGGAYDDDLSSFGWQVTVNAASDFLPTGVEIPVNTGGSTRTRGTTGAMASFFADAADDELCRDNATFAPCSGNGAGCDPALSTSIAHPRLVILEDADGNGAGKPRYYPAAIYNYTGCQSATNTVSVKRMPFTFNPAVDKVYDWTIDTLHPSEYYWRWVAQEVLEGTYEEFFWPRVNMLSNGHMDTNCTGWTDRGAAAVSPSQEPFTPHNATGAVGAIYGNACKFVKPAGNLLKVQFDPVAVDEAKTYVIRGWVSTTAASGPTVRLIDGGDRVTPLTPGSESGVYNIQTDNVRWGNIGSFALYSTSCLHGFCQLLYKFRGPVSSNGTVSLELETAGNNTLIVDHFVMFPDPFDNPTEFTPIFPNVANVAAIVEGDSRSDELWAAFDTVTRSGANAPWPRPHLRFWSPFMELSSKNDGCSIGWQNARAADTWGSEKRKADIIFSLWGLNDMIVGANASSCVSFANDYQGPTELRDRLKTLHDRMRRTGARVVHIFDQRSFGDWGNGAVPAEEGLICETDGITTAGRNHVTQTTNCAKVQTDYQNAVIKAGHLW